MVDIIHPKNCYGQVMIKRSAIEASEVNYECFQKFLLAEHKNFCEQNAKLIEKQIMQLFSGEYNVREFNV